jgi:hypothetical protein
MPVLLFFGESRGGDMPQYGTSIYSPSSMKRVAGVVAVVVLLVWTVVHFSAKPGDPSVEQMAEKLGRTARERLAHKNDTGPKGLQIQETSTAAPPPTASDAAATLKNASPEDKAKARVSAMLTSWKNNSRLIAAGIWAHGLQWDSASDIAASTEGFNRFRQEKGLGDSIGTFEVTNTFRRMNGEEQYTAVDVTLDGVMFHMGVPDTGNAIFWTF